jgi:hypothetical protein
MEGKKGDLAIAFFCMIKLSAKHILLNSRRSPKDFPQTSYTTRKQPALDAVQASPKPKPLPAERVSNDAQNVCRMNYDP